MTESKMNRPPSANKIARKMSGLDLSGALMGLTGSSSANDRGESARREGRFVFEVSWEVANKGT